MIDIGEVSGFLGHRQVATTRKFYAPLASSRLQGASDVLAGRFSGWASPDDEPTADDPIVTLTPAEGVH